jgi:zinc finger protein
MSDENIIEKQPCPICNKKSLTLMEREEEVPYFGKMAIFSMTCSECKYHKADIEALEKKDSSKFTFEVSSEEDLKVRLIKSSEATIKIPHITTITPGPSSQGYITNVEGLLNRVKKEIETLRDSVEDNNDRKKAKNMLKKIQKVMWGREKLKIILEDPTGNSAIVSENAIKSKL